MTRLKSNLLEVSVNKKIVAKLALRRSGNGAVMITLYSHDRKAKDPSFENQSLSVGCLEVDDRETHYYSRQLESVPLEVGDVITIVVKKEGTVSRAETSYKETKVQRDRKRRINSKTA